MAGSVISIDSMEVAILLAEQAVELDPADEGLWRTYLALADLGERPDLQEKALAKLGLPPETQVLFRPPRPPVEGTPEADAYVPCRKCGGIGYHGRIGIYELLEVTPGMKDLIRAGAGPQQLRQQMRTEGMQSFNKEALRLVGEGVTSLEEVHDMCKIDPWFLEQIAGILAMEARIREHGLPRDAENLRMLKAMGFSDARLGSLTKSDAQAVQ